MLDLPEYALSHWPEGTPPMYLRGPFLEFLFLAPDHGLSFIIKLTNFCTRRYTEECVWLDMLLNGETRRWYGDFNVFRWHYDWPCDAPQLQSALMALEFWLCQQIAQGDNVEPCHQSHNHRRRIFGVRRPPYGHWQACARALCIFA